MIYDKARKKAFVYQNGRGRLFTYLEYTPPETGVAEEYYRSLWKKFYDTISIEERNNPKYRQSHMPKRYWENITEMNQTTKSKQIPW